MTENSSSPQSFEIISSLRFDPGLSDAACRHASSYPDPHKSPYYLLAYHQDRLIAAAAHFQWNGALNWLQQDLQSFEEFLDSSIADRSKAWRLRIVVNSKGKARVEANPTVSIDLMSLFIPSLHTNPSLPVWRVYVDTQSTIPSAFTTHKTTARDDYTSARLRAGINSPTDLAEVLVVNPNGEVMEGSITTPYFLRDHMWITPPLSSGGNAGTTRRYALSQGFCLEHTISRDELVDGELCWLSNGVRGFIRGQIIAK
ncbi:Aminotransferase class IV [Penicillium samsonianum]|uniref:Aminotransferase class IV n=1 Tax=Penicillium samsonianum TaxID=1882272 RepID=UPI0025494096|nr:Aminotransferase class IV [Penicillium samsonianum]KAJ6133041.1 Aminotransferase class IV [Penicillium samsonianum]